MTAKSLTALAVERARPAVAGGRYEMWDNLVPGFGLRVTEFGTKSFVFVYRLNGKQGRLTLGRYPGMKVDQARAAARLAREGLLDGRDPAPAPVVPEAPPAVLNDVLETYYARRLRPNLRPASAQEAERALRKSLAATLGDRPIVSIARKDIFELLDGIIDRGAPVHANRVLTLGKTFFAWAVERGYIEASPAAGIKSPTRETARDRVLDRGELVRIWRASDALGYPFDPIVKLLILTAQRRDEVGEMRWGELDLADGLWHIPAERAKNNAKHEVSLSTEARSVLAGIRRGTAPFVFSGNDRTAVSGWSKAKLRLDRLLMAPGEHIGPPPPIAHWTFHDLRRSAATAMADLGTPPHIVDKILNHKTGTIRGVAAIYNRNPYAAERRQALDAWSRHLLDLVEGRTATVVQLRAS